MVLNDVTEFVRNGASIKQEKGCKGTPITRIETISNSRFNYDRLGYADIFDDKYQDYYLQDNDVLLSHINSEKYLGRSVVYKQRTDENIIHGMNLLCLRFLKNRYNPSYFCYYSQSDIARMYISRNTKKSVNQASITATAIKNMPIPTTSIEEQKNVVYHLDSVQSIIDLYNEQMKKLDELIKSRFVEMFGDPILNPKEWKMASIGDIVTEVRYGTSRPSVANGKFPYLRMNNLTYDGHLDLSELKRIDVPDDEIERCIVRKGDVLFNRTNSIELVGKTCVFNESEDMIIAGYIIRVRLKQIMNPIVFSCFMNTDALKNNLRNMAKGAVNQANINAQELQAIRIYLPPLDLQSQFADFVTQVEKQKATVQQSIDKLETLKNSLMQEYFG